MTYNMTGDEQSALAHAELLRRYRAVCDEADQWGVPAEYTRPGWTNAQLQWRIMRLHEQIAARKKRWAGALAGIGQ